MIIMKKRFNVLFLCLCLTLSFGIILLVSSQLTYASTVKADKSKKGKENAAPIDKSSKGISENLGAVGTVEYINNVISKLASNSVNSNLSLNYSSWYTDDTDYLLDGVVDYNFSDNVISFSGFYIKER